MLSNAHLAAPAVVALQKKIAGLKLHPTFRLIIAAEITHAQSLSQTTFDNSKVCVFEASRSLRDVLLGSLACIEPMCNPQPVERARVLLLVAWLHAVVTTRLQYSPPPLTQNRFCVSYLSSLVQIRPRRLVKGVRVQ